MDHTLQQIGEDDGVVMFECTVCLARINFVKAQDEDPHVTLEDDKWVPSANPTEYLGACNEPA